MMAHILLGWTARNWCSPSWLCYASLSVSPLKSSVQCSQTILLPQDHFLCLHKKARKAPPLVAADHEGQASRYKDTLSPFPSGYFSLPLSVSTNYYQTRLLYTQPFSRSSQLHNGFYDQYSLPVLDGLSLHLYRRGAPKQNRDWWPPVDPPKAGRIYPCVRQACLFSFDTSNQSPAYLSTIDRSPAFLSDHKTIEVFLMGTQQTLRNMALDHSTH